METITSNDGKSTYPKNLPKNYGIHESIAPKKISYSFSESFFQILPEGRIRRRQYIGRMFGGSFILGAALVGLAAILGHNILINLLSDLIITLGGYGLWYTLNSKRIRDIGKNPKIVQQITIALITIGVVHAVYVFFGEAGFISGYVTSLIQMIGSISLALGDKSVFVFSWHQMLVQYTYYGTGIISIILFLYLFLVPGAK